MNNVPVIAISKQDSVRDSRLPPSQRFLQLHIVYVVMRSLYHQLVTPHSGQMASNKVLSAT